jgi:hypothetical protein
MSFSPVFCVNCEEACPVSFADIAFRSTVTCAKCGRKFSINELFRHIYENDVYVKKSVDTVIRYATRKWNFTVDKPKLPKGLDHDELQNFLNNTARDILVYGDAFLMTNDPKTGEPRWEMLSPEHVRMKGEQFEVDSETLPSALVVHFKRVEIGWDDSPYGESMIRIVVPYVHQQWVYRRTPPQLQSATKWWSDYLREEVQMGLGGFPDFVLEGRPPKTQPQDAELALVTFLGEVEDLQDTISEGFNEALKRFAEHEHVAAAELEFQKLTTKRVLMDCGVDFSEEKGMIKQLKELGVINQQGYEKMLKDYDGDT